MSVNNLIHKDLVRRFPIRPQYVTQALVIMTRHYFASPERLVTGRFRKRHNQSPQPSPDDQIVIDSPMAWPVERADKRPAIYIRRLPWMTMRLGLGDGRSVGVHEILNQNQYSWGWRGRHAFYLICREGGELELLTEEVINLLLRYTSVIRELFGFRRFQLVNISQPQAYIAATDFFQVGIVVQYEWIETFSLQPSLEEIQQIIAGITAENEERF